MASPFHEVASRLWDAGWSVMPLMQGMKRPFIENWTRYCAIRPEESELSYWLSKPQEFNIGACLGEASGIMALDFDDDTDGLHEKIQGLIPESPLRKAGAKGYTAFYKYNRAIRSRGFNKSGVRVLDVLSDGRQTVIPPSVHPDTQEPYKWQDKMPWEVKIDDLPEIPISVFNDIVKFFKVEPVAPVKFDEGFNDPDLDEAHYTISHIEPDHDYDMWIHVGMALKDQFGESAFALWDRWSALGQKYKGPKETRRKWNSFNSAGVGYGTIVMHAMSNPNFVPPYRMANDEEIAEVIAPGGSMESGTVQSVELANSLRAEAVIKKHTRAISHEHSSLLAAPGMVGRIAKWINETAMYPQPVLALGAALTISGTLMAHKIQTETGSRTNMLVTGLAPSGSGKNHIVSCGSALLTKCGMEDAIAGKPKSGVGLVNGIARRDGVQFVDWDEFGMAMEMMNDRRSNGYQKQVLAIMTELFSKADRLHKGDEGSNSDGKSPPMNVEQPCLSVFGASTEAQFYMGISSKEALNGFLPRWLIFKSNTYPVKAIRNRGLLTIPDDLLKEAQSWANHPVNANPDGDLDISINPRVVPFDEDAFQLWSQYTEGNRQRVADNENYLFNPILSRCGEHAGKIALCAHEGDTITLDVMTWAISISQMCYNFTINACEEHMSDNEHEFMLKRLRKVIVELSANATASKGWIQKGLIGRRSTWIDKQRRDKILQDLMEMGFLEYRSEKSPHNNRPLALFRVIT